MFASLGLAGIVMVGLAVFQVTGEVTRGSDIHAARASWTESAAVSPTAADLQPAATHSNVCGSADARGTRRTGASGQVRPASKTWLRLLLR